MRLGTRIFVCYILVFVLGLIYPMNWFLNDLETRYREGVEELLVDHANILACLVGQEMKEKQFDPLELYNVFDDAYSRELNARIFKLNKKQIDLRVYITDRSGKIVFDSENKKNHGADYSQWRDVFLTLKGDYGARTTRKDPDDPGSSCLYVAAPIYANGDISGVLTVAKPTTHINLFLKSAKPRIIKVGVLSLLAVTLVSFFIASWLTRPIKALTQYANDVRDGKRTTFPELDKSEIGEMGNAFERMREALEGKKYVEQYVQTLTHEIKSPISAIRGAAELLEEKMPATQRLRFLSNIRTETGRIQRIVDRMLELSALENKKNLQKIENVSLRPLIADLIEGMNPLLAQKKMSAKNLVQNRMIVKGDPFHIKQAISNLIQNAIDFSPEKGLIVFSGRAHGKTVDLIVQDNGPGIPDFARDRVFERFFSLQRPDSGEKSTGLGLNYVREVATLHNGSIQLENHPDGGVRAVLTLPAGDSGSR